MIKLPNTLSVVPKEDRPLNWDGHATPTVGPIFAANVSLLDEDRVSEYLTNYAVGYKDPSNLDALMEFVAPSVPVPRIFRWPKFSNAEEFYAEMDDSDVRAIGADFKKVKYTADTVLDETYNKGLMLFLDRDQALASPARRKQATERLLRRLKRIEAYRCIKAGIDAAPNVVANNGTTTWAPAAGDAEHPYVDPDQDVMDDLLKGADDRGMGSNRVLYTQGAWTKRVRTFRGQNTAPFGSSALMTPDQVAGMLGVDQVYISKERYQATRNGKGMLAGANDVVFSFYAESGMTLDDPANIKRFKSEVDGGGFWRVFEYPVGAKFIAIVVEHYSKTVITSPLGMKKRIIA